MAVWNIKTKEQLWKLDSMDYRYENNYFVEITPDNKHVVCGGDRITLRDIQTGGIIWSLENESGTTCALKLSRDGTKIFAAGSFINIYDLVLGKLTKRIFMSEDGEEYYADFNDLAISHDDSYIAAILGDGRTVVWNQSGDVVHVLRKGFDSYSFSMYIGKEVEFSPDDTYLVSFKPDRKSIDIWEMSTGSLINTLSHDSEMRGIKFIPHRDFLLTDTSTGNTIIWNYLEAPNGFKYLEEEKLTSQILSEIKKFREHHMFTGIKMFCDGHVKRFFEKPNKKNLKKLETSFPEYIEGWPQEYRSLIIEEYKRAIDHYGQFYPSKWKKWSKNLFKLIVLIK